MIITLFYNGSIHSEFLPQRVQGSYYLRAETQIAHIERIMPIEALGDSWVLKSTNEAYILGANNRPVRECVLNPQHTYRIKITKNNSDALIYCENTTEDRQKYYKFLISSTGEILIGRSSNCDIVYNNPLVSSPHAVLRTIGDSLFIEDVSRNGTYLNELKVSQKMKLQPGDLIFVMGLKIVVGKGFIAINNPDNAVQINGNKLKLYIPQPIEEYVDTLNFQSRDIRTFSRSKRILQYIDPVEIKIDSPPSSQVKESQSPILTYGPMITMGIGSVIMALTAIINVTQGNGTLLSSLPSIAMAIAMLCTTLLWPTIRNKVDKKKQAEAETKRCDGYRKYLKEIKSKINNQCDIQSEILNDTYISINEYVARVKNRNPHLWEKTIQHDDFLELRIGTGEQTPKVKLIYQERKYENKVDVLRDEQLALAEYNYLLNDVPITIPLREKYIVGVIGKRSDIIPFTKGLLLQAAIAHGYDELKIVIFYNEADPSWNFVRWLPHTWNNDKEVRFVATNSREADYVTSYLSKDLIHRMDRGFKKTDYPHYLIFVCDKDIINSSQFFNDLYKCDKYLGFSVIAIGTNRNQIPSQCLSSIDVSSSLSIFTISEKNNDKIQFTADMYKGDEEDKCARILANTVLSSDSERYILPQLPSILELFDTSKVENINIMEKWRENTPSKSLRAEVGFDESGEIFMLDIFDQIHGPHGLVAGTTGSGKTSIVVSYLLSLALNYHPGEVAFVVIDFKGGSDYITLEGLPHLVGMITSLDGNELKRSLVSINSELKRRQTLFNEVSKQTGITSIDINRYQQLYREGVVSDPLPRLIILADEFAELKQSNGDFIGDLVSVARTGRNVGVHLILAMQNPVGVVNDQILSNMNFRLCLRVNTLADSKMVIDTPEASQFKTENVGRFYVHAGNGSVHKQVQGVVPWGRYVPSSSSKPEKARCISILSNTGGVVRTQTLQGLSESVSRKTQSDAIVEYIRKLAQSEGFAQKKLWLPAIPEIITLDELQEKYGFSDRTCVAPIIGEYDLVKTQEKRMFTLPFERIGHVAVYGATGSGKNLFVTTLVYSLISQYTPDQVHIYALDYAAQTLSIFENAPHVGEVIFPEDEDKTHRLFEFLRNEIKTRSALFREHGGSYTSYKENSNSNIPCIVVIIHNFAALTENNESILQEILYLVREGSRRGIYVVITAQTSNEIRSNIVNNISTRLSLRMNDASDYTNIIGYTYGMQPKQCEGRGLFKTDDVYEFQIAHCAKEKEIQFIKDECSRLNDEWKGQSARSISGLPKTIGLSFIENSIDLSDDLPVGVDSESMSVVMYPVFKKAIMLVLSGSSDVKSFAHALADVAARRDDTEVYVADIAHDLHFSTSPGYTVASGEDESKALLRNFYKEMGDRLQRDNCNGCKRILFVVSSLRKLNQTDLDMNSFFMRASRLTENHRITIAFCENDSRYMMHNSIINQPWAKINMCADNFIWIGKGVADSFVGKSNYRSIQGISNNEDSGVVVIDGVASSVKLISPSS